MAQHAAPGALLIVPIGDAGLARSTLHPGESATMGRGDGCQIRIDDPYVSKEHVQFEWRDEAWYVTDLGSQNGSKLNGWRLTPHDSVILRDGDLLAVGTYPFQLQLVGEAQDQQAAPAGSGTYATRASIFLRLRDDREKVQDLAWEEFRKRYTAVIVGFARNAGLPAQDAEDVLQDVMLGFFRLVPEFEYDPSKGRFRGYLKRATLNAIRKRARGATSAIYVDNEWLDEQASVPDARWETQWSEHIHARALEEARRRVDEKTFEAFQLYSQRGVPAESVAADLGIGINSVHQAKSRVLNIIRAVVDRLRAVEG